MANCIHREDGHRCRRRARYFGRWAGGGLCAAHVGDPEQLHREDRRRYEAEVRTRPGRDPSRPSSGSGT